MIKLGNIQYLITILLIAVFSNPLFSQKTIKIFPAKKTQSSQVYVKKNETLKLSVTGKWTLWNKYDPTDGAGHKIPVNEYGNWGCLLAKIGNSKAFYVGNKTEIISKNNGILYLFPNKGKYKITNESGYLEVTIEGGIPLSDFINNISGKTKKITMKISDRYCQTNIFVKEGDLLEIYAFGAYTLWDGIYPKEDSNGHDFIADNVNWGKLHGGIGTSYGQYIETFPIGEKTIYTVKNSGLLSFYPFSNNYDVISDCTIDIYLGGGIKVKNQDKKNIDTLVRKKTELLLLSKINDIRNKLSIPKIVVNSILSQTASSHAKYMITNDVFTRKEEEKKQFFTGKTLKERLITLGYNNKSRELYCQTEKAEDAFDLFMNTVYHRLRLLNPNLKEMGYGGYRSLDKTIHVFDFGYSDENIEWEAIAYPPNGSSNTKTIWSGDELPNPFPVGTTKPLGAPVSIIFKKQIKTVIASSLTDEKDKTVNCFTITPKTDLNNKKINSIILVPKRCLNPNTKYTANIKVLLEDNKESIHHWTFKTKR